MNKRLAKSLLVIIFGLSMILGFSKNAFAADFNVVKSKAALEGVWKCFSLGNAYYGQWSTDNGGLGLLWNRYHSEQPVKLPYGLTDANNNNTDCREIMEGFGTNSAGDDDYLNQGLVPKEIQNARSSNDIADFWEKTGYKATADSETVELGWQTLTYAVKDKNKCTDSNGNLLSNKFKNLSTGESYDELRFPAITKVKEGWNNYKSEFDNTGINVPVPGSYETYKYEVCGVTVDVVNEKSRSDETAYEFRGDVAGSVTVTTWNGEYSFTGDGAVVLKRDATHNITSLEPRLNDTTSQGAVRYIMDLISPMTVIVGLNNNNKIGYSVSNLADYDGLAFTNQEVYDLYVYYIKDVYNVPVICEGQESYSLYDDNNSRLINWASGKKCRAHIANENVKNPKNVYGVDMSTLHFGKVVSLQDVIDALAMIDLSNISGAQQGGTIITPTPEPGETETDLCYKNSGSLGWIACPIITALHGIGNKMWNQIETYHMVVPASEVFKSGGGVEKGWGLVRDIANVLFVILFLVVIFSQLTGVGIDNYGIKKILPRLIVVAILVNLSYVICELAVDLSNILGMGLNNTLSNLAGNLAVAGDGASIGGQVVAWTLTGIFAVGGTFLWGLLSAGSAAGALVWIGLAVLGIAIMIIAAMLFLYLTLVVREAGIVLSIVLAPVAIVCYALPNTEKMGKKWFDLFKAMLLVYPICGAMIGGGQLAGSILASIDNDGMKLAAAIVQVVPFFFIPMVLRNSLSLMGNVGAKLSSLGKSWGRKASGFAQNSIKSTNRYKDFIQYQQSQTAARKAQRVKDRLDRRSGGNVAILSARQQDRLSKANETLKAEANRQQQAQINANNSNYTAALAKQNLQNDEAAQDTLLYNDANFIVAQQIKGQNARTDRQAEADVGVFSLNQGLAMSRAQSRRDTQELKAYQDQFAGFSQAQLRAEAAGASTWLSQPGGSQRMSALVSAMEANGMERDIFSTIRSNDVSSYSGVMQTLAASKNKVLKAYGKKGQGIDYNTFMNGTGAGSLEGYIGEKGKDFVDGLDDKALAEIASYTVNGQVGGALSTDLAIEAAARINSQDAVNVLDGLLSVRSDFRDNISGEQLVQFNDSTVSRLMGNARARAAMDKATDAIANDPNLVGRLSANRKQQFNAAFRNGNTKPFM